MITLARSAISYAETIGFVLPDDAEMILDAFDTVKGYGHCAQTAIEYAARLYDVSQRTVLDLLAERELQDIERLAVLAEAQSLSILLRKQAG